MRKDKQSPYDTVKLKRAFAAKGISQGALARRLKTSQANLSRILNGRRCHPPTVRRVARALGLDIEDITLQT